MPMHAHLDVASDGCEPPEEAHASHQPAIPPYRLFAQQDGRACTRARASVQVRVYTCECAHASVPVQGSVTRPHLAYAWSMALRVLVEAHHVGPRMRRRRDDGRPPREIGQCRCRYLCGTDRVREEHREQSLTTFQ